MIEFRIATWLNPQKGMAEDGSISINPNYIISLQRDYENKDIGDYCWLVLVPQESIRVFGNYDKLKKRISTALKEMGNQ